MLNPPCGASLFYTEENVPEHRQYTPNSPQRGNLNHKQNKSGTKRKKKDIQM